MSNKHEFKNSSSISNCDYNDDEKCMTIEFSSGQKYKYPDCKKEDYEALKAAASPGKHFHTELRKFKSVKVSG